MTFRVWIDFSQKVETIQQKLTEQNPEKQKANQEETDNKVSKMIKLKTHKLNEDMLAYLRMTLI